MDHKQAVIDYLKSDRSLMGGRNLYNKLPGKSRAFQNTLARFRETPINLDKLYYQLAKTVGLPERNLKMLLQKPVAKQTTEPKSKPKLTLDDQLIAFNQKSAKYQEALKLAKGLDLQLPDRKKVTVFNALEEARTALVKKK